MYVIPIVAATLMNMGLVGYYDFQRILSKFEEIVKVMIQIHEQTFQQVFQSYRITLVGKYCRLLYPFRSAWELCCQQCCEFSW